MKNKVIIPENSGLNPGKHKRVLEILAQAPLDFLSVITENPQAKVYPKLELASSSPVGGINFSHLKFCLESPFYKLNFYGNINYKQKGILGYDIYSENKRKASLWYIPNVQELPHLSVRTPNNFTFIIEVCPKKLLGPDGNPLFPEIISSN